MVAIFVVLFSAVSAGEIQIDDFSEIKKVTKTMLASFPLEQTLFVGVGRGPTPIAAMLDAIKPNCAFNLPLTHFRYGAIKPIPLLKKDKKLILFQHFERKVFNRKIGANSP